VFERANFTGGYEADIAVMDPDGSNVVILPEIEAGYTDTSDPDWSPDGERIVVEHDPLADENEIYTIEPDGSNPTRLTDTTGDNQEPAWSPDGTKIVYEHDNSGFDQLWVMNADGTNKMQLTFSDGD
jgi:TolB protein